MATPISKVGIATASYKPKVRQCAVELCQALRGRNCDILLSPCTQELSDAISGGLCELVDLPDLVQADIIISLGGDGTLLAVAHQAGPRGIPLLGIDLGTFGFVAAEPFEVMMDKLDNILEGDFRVESRLMVAAEVLRDGELVSELCGLNEAVIAKTDVRHLVRLQTLVNGEHMATYPADGLIISTPTGSTAYGLSAGGPIVSPAVESLSLTPICSHTLYSRPLVVEPTAVIEITAGSRGRPAVGVSVTLDGQEAVELEPGDTVRVHRAPFDAKLVRLASGSFYERLRTKLHWDAER